MSLLAPASYEAEQYRILRQRLERLRGAPGVGMVGVSSPVAGDGKTTTAINLAGTLAQAPDARVLLVDADLRRPSVADQLGLAGGDRPGLADAIRTPDLPLAEVIRPLPSLNLTVLPAGPPPAAPYEALRSPRMEELLREARARFEYVVLDAPPLLPLPDCQVLARWTDGFLIVVAAHRTPRRMVGEALEAMEPEKVLGLVFNGVDPRRARGYGYYLGYGEAYAARRPVRPPAPPGGGNSRR